MARNQPRDLSNRPRGLMAFLSIAVLLGVIALGLSIINAIALSAESDVRENERIAADLTSCERGNKIRQQVADIAGANRDLIDGIIDVVLADRPERHAELEADLAPVFERYGATVAGIDLVDCADVTPGATSTSLPGENP